MSGQASTPGEFAGQVELMPVAAREQRLQALTEELQTVIAEHDGEVFLPVVLDETASRIQVGVSQVKQGMNYALARKAVFIDMMDMVRSGKPVESQV